VIAGRVLAIASLIGFSYGAFVEPTLLQSVDVALVASRVLRLPESNPAYVWATTSYSLYSIQMPALLLKLGVPPLKLCVLLSGIQAAAATSAVAAWTLLLSRNWPLAIFTPFLFMHMQFSGHRYPVVFPLTEYDPGTVGFYATLLTLALLGLRWFHAAALLTGLMPSSHPIWALACWSTAGLALLKGGPRRLRCLRPSLKWFLAGLAVVAVSYLVQRVVIQGPGPPPADPQLVARYSEGFIKNWGGWGHTQPAGFERHPLRLFYFFEGDLYFWALGLAFLQFLPGAASRGLRFLLGALLVISVLVAGSVLVEELTPVPLPSTLRMLIIARLLNVDAILYPILVLGGLSQLAFRLRSLAGASLITGLLALVHSGVVTRTTVFRIPWSGLTSRTPTWDAGGVAFVASAVALLALIGLRRRSRKAGEPEGRAAAGPLWPRRLATVAILALAGTSLVPLAATGYRRWRHGSVEDLRGDPSSRGVYDAAARGQGLLIVFPRESWPQIKTGRPVVLSPALVDVLVYLPQSAPSMEDILEGVYGVSLLKEGGFLDVRRLWQARRREGWQKVRERFEATDVLVPSRWILQLPEVARSENLVLYHIPEDGALPP